MTAILLQVAIVPVPNFRLRRKVLTSHWQPLAVYYSRSHLAIPPLCSMLVMR